MQAPLNNNPLEEEHLNGEVIAFYGDLTSMSPNDVDFRGLAITDTTVLSYVKEHQSETLFTMMHTQEDKIGLDLQKEILTINPDTQFMRVDNLEEFTQYYDFGSKTMDRELHPVESVEMLNDVLFYDIKEREKPEVVEKQVPKEYVKASTIEPNERTNLTNKMKIISEMSPEDFVAYSGLQGFDLNSKNDVDMIKIVQFEMHKEFSQTYILPSVLQTAKDNITTAIPGTPAKSIKDGLLDGVEFVHDLLGDKDEGHLEIELDCETRGECHPKVHRVHEDDSKKEVEVNEKGQVVLDGNSTQEKNENIEEKTNTQEKETDSYNISPTVDTYLNDMKEQMANVDDNSSGRTLHDDFGDMD